MAPKDKPTTVALEAVSSNTSKLRAGEWNLEEDNYCQVLINEFEAGVLALEVGSSLRQFLAKMLHCKPTRVSKRFEGSSQNKGKKSYVKSAIKLPFEVAIRRRRKLMELERNFWINVSEPERAEELLSISLFDEHLKDHSRTAIEKLHNTTDASNKPQADASAEPSPACKPGTPDSRDWRVSTTFSYLRRLQLAQQQTANSPRLGLAPDRAEAHQSATYSALDLLLLRRAEATQISMEGLRLQQQQLLALEEAQQLSTPNPAPIILLRDDPLNAAQYQSPDLRLGQGVAAALAGQQPAQRDRLTELQLGMRTATLSMINQGPSLVPTMSHSSPTSIQERRRHARLREEKDSLDVKPGALKKRRHRY